MRKPWRKEMKKKQYTNIIQGVCNLLCIQIFEDYKWSGSNKSDDSSTREKRERMNY